MRPSRSSTAGLVALLTFALPPALVGQEATGTGATFLLLPVGARATALGQATASDGGTADAAFANPAGLARLRRSEFVVHYASLPPLAKNGVLGAYWTDDRFGTLGVAAYIADFGTEPVTGPGGPDPVGQVATRNIELLASYATVLTRNLAFGVNYKLIQLRQDCSGDCRRFGPSIVGTTHAVDIGLQWTADDGRLEFGAAVRHAGFKLQLVNRDQADPLPTRLVIGASWTLPVSRMDGQTLLDARFLVNLQDAFGEYRSPEALFGAELGYGDLARLRAGYAFVGGSARGPAVGVGLRYEGVTVDFARVFYETAVFEDPAFLTLRVGL